MNNEFTPEVLEAARWIQRQVTENPFCDAGINLSVHDGEVRRIDRSLVTKHKPTARGGHHEPKSR